MYVVENKMKLMEPEFAEAVYQPRNLVIEYIHDQVFNKNSNFLCLWAGKPGSGKSRGALKACELLSKRCGRRFSITHVVFSIEDFLRLVNNYAERFEQGEDVRGVCILYDEAGISMDNRDWQSKVHKAMNDCAETFRYLGLVVMMTAPGRGRIDSKLRELMHAMFHIQKKTARYTVVKFLLLKESVVLEKEFKTHLRVEHRGWVMKITSIQVPLPSQHLNAQYEIAMIRYKRAVGVRSLASVTPRTAEAIAQTPQGRLTDKQKRILRLSQSGLTKEEIAMQFGISPSGVGTHLRNIRSKGYVV